MRLTWSASAAARSNAAKVEADVEPLRKTRAASIERGTMLRSAIVRKRSYAG